MSSSLKPRRYNTRSSCNNVINSNHVSQHNFDLTDEEYTNNHPLTQKTKETSTSKQKITKASYKASTSSLNKSVQCNNLNGNTPKGLLDPVSSNDDSSLDINEISQDMLLQIVYRSLKSIATTVFMVFWIIKWPIIHILQFITTIVSSTSSTNPALKTNYKRCMSVIDRIKVHAIQNKGKIIKYGLATLIICCFLFTFNFRHVTSESKESATRVHLLNIKESRRGIDYLHQLIHFPAYRQKGSKEQFVLSESLDETTTVKPYEAASKLKELIFDKLIEKCFDIDSPSSQITAFHQFKKQIPDKVTVKTDANGKLLLLMDHFYHVLKEDPSIWSSFWDAYDTLIKIENQKEANDSKFIIINKRVFESKMELDLITMKLQNDQRPMNMADFALESRGGRILYSKTSPTSNTMAPWKFHIRRLMGLPVHYYPPKYAIQPGLYVGECWSMNGCEGTLGILLSEPILIHSVAIEYPSLHTLMDKVNQAPKDIEILGLPNYPNSGEPLSLGDVTFNIHGSKNKYKSNLQLYNLDFYPEVPIRAVIIKIKSNWGSIQQTDIYGIRIYGIPETYID